MSTVAEHVLDAAALRRVVEKAQQDPAWWVSEVFGQQPWPKQRTILESVRDHSITAVPACHSAGKSWIAARVVLWFVSVFKPSVVLTTAPSERQVRMILWKEIAVAYRQAERRGFPLGGRLLTQEYRIAEDHFVVGFAAPHYDPDRFQGFHSPHILVVADEASGISKQIFEGIESILSTEHARLLAIGNPTDPTSEFAKLCSDPDVRVIPIGAYDTPNFTAFGITEQDIADGTWEPKLTGPLPYPTLITPAWAARIRRKYGERSPYYIARVRGQFPVSASDALFAYSWVESAMYPERWEACRDTRPVVLGVDPARFGDARTVIVLRQGDRARVLEAISGMDTMQVARRVAQLQADWGARVHIDAVGLGAGIYDYLRHQGRQVVGLEASQRADDDRRFANKRAEWYWHLRERFQEGRIALEQDEELEAQLVSLKYGYDSKDRIIIQSKEDMRRHGLPSPDRADALMLAFAEADTWTADWCVDLTVLDVGLRPSPWEV